MLSRESTCTAMGIARPAELAPDAPRGLQHLRSLLVGSIDRNDGDLDGCQPRWNLESAVVAVGHDQSTDHSGGRTPARAPRVIGAARLRLECEIEGLGEILS